MDHEERRLLIAEALWRLCLRDGWEAVSLRKVAAEAGVSMGLVQHYFTTRNEMLRFAMGIIVDDTVRRIRARVAALPGPHTPRRLVETVLGETIPRAERREAEVAAAEVFVRRYQLGPNDAPDAPDLRAFLVEQARLGGRGDPEVIADGLLALLDGLMLGIVSGAHSADSALAVLSAQLDYVFGNAVG